MYQKKKDVVILVVDAAGECETGAPQNDVKIRRLMPLKKTF